jgi:hypothetical protein
VYEFISVSGDDNLCLDHSNYGWPPARIHCTCTTIILYPPMIIRSGIDPGGPDLAAVGNMVPAIVSVGSSSYLLKRMTWIPEPPLSQTKVGEHRYAEIWTVALPCWNGAGLAVSTQSR